MNLHSVLRNRYNKERTPGNWNAFKKQRNKFVETLRQAKREDSMKMVVCIILFFFLSIHIRNLQQVLHSTIPI